MIIAITGANGFIGRHVVKMLAHKNSEIRALTREIKGNKNSDITWYEGDLLDPETIDGFLDNVNVLIHCAGEFNDESQYMPVNYYASIKLLELASKKGVRKVVSLSSVGVYGHKLTGPVDEGCVSAPEDKYELSKALFDTYLLKQNKMKVTIIRPSIVYGADMKNQSLKALVRAIYRKKFFFISGGRYYANYIHVDEVASLICEATIQSDFSPGIYNISETMDMKDFVYYICDALNIKKPRVVLPYWLVKLMANIMDIVSEKTKIKFPLTSSRVDAMCMKQYYTSSYKHETVENKSDYTSGKAINSTVANWLNNSELF